MYLPLRLTFQALLLFVATASAAAVETPTGPRWPLDLPTRYLTSNFMEYRGGRFHAGLDLKTRTVSGFAARAVEDGWIVRVRATPTAYGRAVYLRGASGRTYVYAHLSRFNDHLGDLLERQRQRTGHYRAQLEFRPGAEPVRQGEVLGLTGESGTGGPHLHFEVRDESNRPIDPQSVGFAVGDTIAPVIGRVRVWPATADALVEGDQREHLLAANNGLRGAQPSLRVNGPVAFSARITDAADIRGHSLEPALIEVQLDGDLVYRCRNERYDFGENAQQRLEWVAVPGVREHWLHRRPGIHLTGREGGLWYLGDAGAGLTAGSHDIRITAADQAGNRTRMWFELVVADSLCGPAARADAAWSADPVSLELASPDSLSHLRLTPFFDVEPESFRAAVPGLERLSFAPEGGDPVLVPLVVYRRPVALTAAQWQSADEQGLHLLGAAEEYLAADWPIDAALRVDFRVPSAAASDTPASERATWFLCRWSGGKWSAVGAWPGAVAGESTARVTLDAPGVHALVADHSGPVIGRLAPDTVVGPGPVSTVAGVTLPFWEVLPVPVLDSGVGLAAESLRVQLDGVPLIVEPDLPRDRILVEFPDAMPAGRHRLVVEASDEAGHTARKELSFEARR